MVKLFFFSEACALASAAEEHVSGGMGTAVAEFLSQHMPVSQEFVGGKR